MAQSPEDKPLDVSRREWLKTAGLVGAAVVTPAVTFVQGQADAPENLTTAEADALDAIVARLIPTDDNGPGAREARTARYIDRALGGFLAPSRDAYRDGLASVDRYARTSKGARFADLSAADQDAVLTDMEKGTAAGFTPNSTSFFALVRTHTIQGTFGDPYYGGNANFTGWDLIGYPGVRLVVTEADQRLDPNLAPTHLSAYDYGMFSPKPARAGLRLLKVFHGD